jgi:hypothetical protein
MLRLHQWGQSRQRRWLVPAAAAALILHQSVYLWTYKHHQYAQRAEPTERLVRVGRQSRGPIYAKCFPYSFYIAEYALKYRLEDAARPAFIIGPEAERQPGAIDFCNDVAYEAIDQ